MTKDYHQNLTLFKHALSRSKIENEAEKETKLLNKVEHAESNLD